MTENTHILIVDAFAFVSVTAFVIMALWLSRIQSITRRAQDAHTAALSAMREEFVSRLHQTEERQRVLEMQNSILNHTFGYITEEVRARFHIFVDKRHGAHMRRDAPPVNQAAEPVALNAGFSGFSLSATRSGFDERDAPGDPNVIHEADAAQTIPGVEFMCGEENGQGCLWISMEQPWDVHLVWPGGMRHPLPVERGEDRYYASVDDLPDGEYSVEIVRPRG